MARTLGVDLSPGRCALVELSGRGTAPRLRRFASLDVGSDEPERLAGELRRLRREQRLSRYVRAVVWNEASLVPTADGDYHDRVTPLGIAGFTVERLATPPEGLATLAGTVARDDDRAVGYLAVNPDGAALAIVRGGELLLGHDFDWATLEDPRKPDPRALGRRLGAAIVKVVRDTSAGGFPIDRIVLCGARPQLRALALPLSEALGSPVETLDTLEGIETAGLETSIFEFQRQLPGLRLAWAMAADTRATATGRFSTARRWVRAVAAAGLLTAAAAAIIVACWPSRQPTTAPSNVVVPAPAPDQLAPVIPAPDATASAPAPPPGRSPAVPAPTRARVGRHTVELTLISGNRRLALVDGRIVGPGDRVGRDLVVEVGERDVVFAGVDGGLWRVSFRAVAVGVSIR